MTLQAFLKPFSSTTNILVQYFDGANVTKLYYGPVKDFSVELKYLSCEISTVKTQGSTILIVLM